MSPRKPRPEPLGAQGRTPSLREQLRPVELLGIAAVIGVFVGLVVLLSSREPLLAVIMFGIAFIVVLVVLALFVLGLKPDGAEKEDLAEQNGEAAPGTAAPGTAAPDAGGRDAGNGDAGGPASTPRAPRNPHD